MMGFTWYILGVLTTFSICFLYGYSKQRHLSRPITAGLALGIFLIIFSIAWAVGSVLEGVPRAASMGLLFFGLGGIVIILVMLRITGSQSKSASL